MSGLCHARCLRAGGAFSFATSAVASASSIDSTGTKVMLRRIFGGSSSPGAHQFEVPEPSPVNTEVSREQTVRVYEGMRADEKIAEDQLTASQRLAALGANDFEQVAAGAAGEAVPSVFSRELSPACPGDMQGFLARGDKPNPRLDEEFFEHLCRRELGGQLGEDGLAEDQGPACQLPFEKSFRGFEVRLPRIRRSSRMFVSIAVINDRATP